MGKGPGPDHPMCSGEEMVYMRKTWIILYILFFALGVPSVGAQKTTVPSPIPAKDNQKVLYQGLLPDDPLGRSTPRGTVLGFLRAVGREDYERAVEYLDTKQPPKRAIQLARQLQSILDMELSREVADLDRKARAGKDDSLGRPFEKIGSIRTGGRTFEINLERVQRDDEPPVWLFSSETLRGVPEVWAELDIPFAERYLPQVLTQKTLLYLPWWRWLLFVLLIPAILLVSWLVTRLVTPLIRLTIRRISSREDESWIERIKRPIRLLVFGLGSFAYAAIPSSVLASLLWRRVAQTVTVISLTWLSLHLIDIILEKHRANQRRESSGKTAFWRLLGQLSKVLTVVAGGAILLYYAGFNLTAILTGLGVSGIAIAFAAQKTLENLFGGIMIVSDKPIRVGDFCRAGEHRGVVEDIGLRSTRIRTVDRTVVSVPNGQLSAMSLENFTLRDKIRFKHVINIKREITSKQLREVLHGVRTMLNQNEHVEPQSARVRLTAIKDSSFELEVFAYVLATSWEIFLKIQEDLLLDMIDIVEASGSSLAPA